MIKELTIKNKEIITEVKFEKGTLVNKAIQDKTNDCLYTAEQKKYKDVSLYTSKGYKTFPEFTFSLVKAESSLGVQEFIVGTSMFDAYKAIDDILEKKVTFEDLGSYLELKINYEAIDYIANRLIEENNL